MTRLLSRLRPALALLGVLAVFGVVAYGLLAHVLPSGKPPELPSSEAKTPRLAKRLLVVIVDGLRWDVANDPSRMPNFSRALAEHASGELWAGRVSMTTSAVLTMVTGERGGFEQIVFNADPSPPPYESWLAKAKAQGLSLMLVGDPAWSRMYGESFDEVRLDPAGVSIDVDFNPQTFRDARELRNRRPDVLIVHFVTPDHQAHAHTVPSAKYADHIRGFDRDLDAFLRELDASWTVFVAGDHGAADSGTHGADVPIQRRSVIYAYGPGIASTAKQSGRIDQADLAGTFAALLGLPLPAHSRGHVLVDWLKLSPETSRALSCENASRAIRLARARGLTEVADGAERRLAGCQRPELAREAVASVDRGVESSTGLASPIVLPLLFAATALALGVMIVVFGRAALVPALIAAGVGALGVGATYGVERLPGALPNIVRISLFSLGNLIPLALLVAPARSGALLERLPKLAPALLPGVLIATYTTNAQPETFVALVVGAIVLVLIGGLDGHRRTLLAARRVLHPAELALLLVAGFVLFFPGTRTSDVVPAWLRRDGGASLAAGCALIALTAAALMANANERRRLGLALTGATVAMAALAARRVIFPWTGRIAVLLALGFAIAFALRGRKLLALLSGVACYALISRDFELVALSALLIVADGAGIALRRHREHDGTEAEPLSLGTLLLATAFCFGLAFVGRIGVQGALDFGSMDWGAAGFGDPHVPAWVVGSALGLKYALAVALPIGAFASSLPRQAAAALLAACFAAFLARGVIVTGMFLIAGGSFWTGLRALGDLPFGYLWALAIALLWLGLTLQGSKRALSANS